MGSSNDVKVGGWGGNGGRADWEFSIPGDGNLSRIQVVSNGECIYSLRFTTISQQGGQHNSPKHGGAGNMKDGRIYDIQFGYGELLSEIRGTYGEYPSQSGNEIITSLTFVIGTKENGPYGKQSGTAFSLPVINGKITGFWGNSDKFLDSFGVFLAI